MVYDLPNKLPLCIVLHVALLVLWIIWNHRGLRRERKFLDTER